MPQSGDLFIFPKEQTKQGAQLWRNDGLEYKSRKNHTSVQESQMKLVIDKQEVITCAYAKGATCRRAYWLIHNPQFVIVQYLDEHATAGEESEKRKGGAQPSGEASAGSRGSDPLLLFDEYGPQNLPDILVDGIVEDMPMQQQDSLFASSFERPGQEQRDALKLSVNKSSSGLPLSPCFRQFSDDGPGAERGYDFMNDQVCKPLGVAKDFNEHSIGGLMSRPSNNESMSFPVSQLAPRQLPTAQIDATAMQEQLQSLQQQM